MLWVKAFHIIFVIAWFAGLLYLPRLFVYHARTTDEAGKERFKIMERKLLGLMTMGAAGAIICGAWLLTDYAWAAFGSSWWLLAKLSLVAVLVGFHSYCAMLVKAFKQDRNSRSARYFRFLNEVPAVIMMAVVILVVVKPQ